MTEKKKGGFGQPPEGRRWEKGQSGNRAGRPPKPLLTWAQIIEREWIKPVALVSGELVPAMELILRHLMDKIKDGDRRAERVLRKYKAAFRRKLLLAYENGHRDDSTQDGRHKKYEPGPNEPLSEKERKYRTWQRDVDALCPAGGRLDLMPLKEAAKLLRLLQKAPECPTSRDPWRRHRSRNLADTEIFDQVINSPVLLNESGRRKRVPRMGGMIAMLVAGAAKGDVNSAEVLINLHGDSMKNGDYGIPKRSRK